MGTFETARTARHASRSNRLARVRSRYLDGDAGWPMSLPAGKDTRPPRDLESRNFRSSLSSLLRVGTPSAHANFRKSCDSRDSRQAQWSEMWIASRVIRRGRIRQMIRVSRARCWTG
jgi:hypothetical protein